MSSCSSLEALDLLPKTWIDLEGIVAQDAIKVLLIADVQLS
jgi:hypothetical protein